MVLYKEMNSGDSEHAYHRDRICLCGVRISSMN